MASALAQVHFFQQLISPGIIEVLPNPKYLYYNKKYKVHTQRADIRIRPTKRVAADTCPQSPLSAGIVVVKKTFRYSNVFFYNPLYRNSVIRNIIMESGISTK